MPNLDTHAGLAFNHNPEGGIEFAAGEVFDDAVRMVGGVPNLDVDESLFSQGIHSNNAVTDPAFDSQPLLRSAQRAMSEDLGEVDIPRNIRLLSMGPGTDILFSGVTLQRPDITAYLDVCGFFKSSIGQKLIRQHVKPANGSTLSIDQITDGVLYIAGKGLRPEYSDPAYVVDRLRVRVSTRPRLSFPKDFDQTVLTKIFATQQVRLAQSSEDIYAGTISTINGDSLLELKQKFGLPTMPIVPGLSSLVERSEDPATVAHIEGWEDILTDELRSFKGDNESRRKKFIASRAAAHFLLQHVSRYPENFTVSGNSNGSPAFPIGWTGSISHSGDYAAAAIASKEIYEGVGIDIETRVVSNGRARVLTEHEQTLEVLDSLQTRTLYSIKEAIFKAVHPLVSQDHPGKFWFRDAEIVSLDPDSSTVKIRMSNTEHGNKIARILGEKQIKGYFLDKKTYSAAVCTVA